MALRCQERQPLLPADLAAVHGLEEQVAMIAKGLGGTTPDLLAAQQKACQIMIDMCTYIQMLHVGNIYLRTFPLECSNFSPNVGKYPYKEHLGIYIYIYLCKSSPPALQILLINTFGAVSCLFCS